MDDATDLLGFCPRFLQHLARAQKRAARRIVGRRVFLPDDGAAVTRIVDDEIGEGSPDVDAEGERRRGIHSARILPCFTTFAQRSRSFRIAALKAGPSCGTATSPRDASSGAVAGSFSASRKSLLRAPAISRGRPAGPPQPDPVLLFAR